MLRAHEQKKILEIVQESPKTIQELAQALDKNWRTANSYVERIIKETGLINIKTFREGTRGALKIVYWSALEKTQSSYQEQLSKRILLGSQKEDFSAFDIFQFLEEKIVDQKNTEFILEGKEGIKEKLLVFSGNGSWIDEKRLKEFEKIAKKAITIKVLLRIDVSSQKVVKKLLAINQRIGEDIIVIRHVEQPLRGIICDNTAQLKETLSPKQSRYRELKKEMTFKYTIKGPWASWLEKIFWQMWETSVDAHIRLDAMNVIKKD